jgi:hypothetical protein
MVALRSVFVILSRRNANGVSGGASAARLSVPMSRVGVMRAAMRDAMALMKRDAGMSRSWKRIVGVVP